MSYSLCSLRCVLFNRGRRKVRSVTGYVILFGVIPFLLSLCAQGWRSLSTIAICLFAFIGYGLYQPEKSLADSLGHALFLLAAIGAGCGVLTSAVTIYLRSRGVTIGRRMIAVAIGMILVPTTVFAPCAVHAWNNRPPSSDCNFNTVTFDVAGQQFVVPGLAIVSASLGDGRPGRGDPLRNHVGFYGNASLREFCDAFDNGHTPAAVNAVFIRLSESARHVRSPRFAELCRRAAWPEQVCAGKLQSGTGGLPQSLTLYDSARYRTGFGGDLEVLKRQFDVSSQPSDVSGFQFDGHNYLWIDAHADHETGVPFALKCFKSGPHLYCAVDDPIAGTVRITYGGLVRLATPVEDARQMRQQVRLLMTKMRQP